MKIRAIAALLACTSLVLSATAQGFRSAVTKMNNKVSATFLKNDNLKSFDKLARNLVTKDFKHIDNGSTTDYDQMLSQMKGSMGMLKITSSKTTVVKAKQKGSTGTATVKHMMRGRMVGPDKKTHRMVMSGTSTETLRKEDGKWKLAEMKWLSTNMTMDGKKMNPEDMGGK